MLFGRRSGLAGIARQVSSAQAIARFTPGGRLKWANANFLELTGYSWHEIRGRDHRDLVGQTERDSQEYQQFWDDLRSGQNFTRIFQRVTKSGNSIWVHASYLPQVNVFGRVREVLKIASDISVVHSASTDRLARLDAIDRSHAMAEFSSQGQILAANANFLTLMDYSTSEIIGQPHAILVDSEIASGSEYRQFWTDLRDGRAQAGEFARRQKDGQTVWVQASYNPVLDADCNVARVIMTANHVSDRVKAGLDAGSKLAAIGQCQAIIEFDTSGKILTANENFLDVMGFGLSEIVGRHHRMFVDPIHAESSEYETFWSGLRAGHFQSAEFKRYGKNGREIWIQAIYSPILDRMGKVEKVVKFATDITEAKRISAANQAQIDAIGRSQAVIAFDLDGTIRSANENFLTLMKYDLTEIVGRHHRIFLPRDTAASPEYQAFWERMRDGNFESADFKRIAKDGSVVWIKATYNPIFDVDGKVTGVIKIASDITAQRTESAKFKGQIAALNLSQSVIEFDLTGKILHANANFLRTMGYRAEDIIGQHHSMFLPPQDAKKPEYKAFWNDLRAGSFKTGQFARLNSSGQNVWIEGTYCPIRDPEGKPESIFKFATDITEQMGQRERVSLLSLVTDETDNSVIITDKNGLIDYVNRGFERLTGYDLASVRGKKPGDILQGPETCRQTKKRIAAALSQGKPFYEEILNYTKAGSPYWISLAVNPIYDSEGVLQRFVSIQSNIDTTKQASLEYTRRLDAIGSTSAFAEWHPNGDLAERNEYLVEACGKSVPNVPLNTVLDTGERACLNFGETIQKQLSWPRPGREPLILNAIFNSVPDQSGKIAKILMFGIDVSVRDQIFESAIDLVRNSSMRIGNIVEGMQEIANEIRNLSLNATVEASRSGESGKGFAVVANEVRALADRSRTAVVSIQDLLKFNSIRLAEVEQRLADLNAGRRSDDATSETQNDIMGSSSTDGVNPPAEDNGPGVIVAAA